MTTTPSGRVQQRPLAADRTVGPPRTTLATRPPRGRAFLSIDDVIDRAPRSRRPGGRRADERVDVRVRQQAAMEGDPSPYIAVAVSSALCRSTLRVGQAATILLTSVRDRAVTARLTEDVATNVAIHVRRWRVERDKTTADWKPRSGLQRRCTSSYLVLGSGQASDRIGLGDRLQYTAGRVRRFAGCMAWKRSGVRFPLAPRKTAGQRPANDPPRLSLDPPSAELMADGGCMRNAS